jgi:CubicO group peptidase (beta-lactamase class C family)
VLSPDHPRMPSFDPDRLERVRELCRRATETGEVPGIALVVAGGGRPVLNESWGVREAGGNDPTSTDTIWLIASVTKPVVAAGICLLLERGELVLDDPVRRLIPEFSGEDRAGVTLRHLLTHSSGLPDMLPEDRELRRAHAPLPEFIRRICTTPLLFAPGTDVRYQSTGIALLGEVIERVTGQRCRDFLDREFFQPLGMTSGALGWKPEFAERLATVRLPDEQQGTDWHWNSPYWRDFGAPWGGMFATAEEFTRFLGMVGGGGVWDCRRYLGRATVSEMTRNQTADLPDLPDAVRRRSTWGLGWRHAAGRESDYLGDLVSSSAFGHGGATGTAVWHDSQTGVSFVLFTNQPGIGRFAAQVGNAVLAAVWS